jgi:ABC-2 type transport system permease protein/oleandomycin transport system permease protein
VSAITIDRGLDGPDTDVRPAALNVSSVISDNLVLAWRNLIKFRRNNRLMLLSTVQPLTQMVLFAYVFNSVAHVPGVEYKQFVVPGVLVQTVVLAAMRTGVAVSVDLDTGMMDRFRTLPIARSAVLVGRTISDTARIALQTVLLVAIAVVIIGFRFTQGPVRAVGVMVVIVAFGMALTAFSGWVGLCVDDPETAQTSLMVPIMPLVFTSSAFAPISRLPSWMQLFARINPVTSAVDLCRGLALGGPLMWPFQRFVVSVVVITTVFTVLGVRRYRRA